MKRLIILFLILILGAFLRFYHLGSVPVGFHRDEAFLGYNAYSLLLNGRDMSGNVLPIHLESFIYSPAGYAYASIPFIALFGLNEFSVRFASAFFGTATILLVYFFVKELFREHKKIHIKLALLSSFFLAISPWHINLSRVATENVLVVFFITLGLLLYFLWLRTEKKWLLVASVISFAITLLLYQAPRAFLPLFLPALFHYFHPKNLKKHIVLPVVLFILLIVLPVLMILSSHDLSQRIRMLSIFQNPQTQLVLDEQIREDQGQNTYVTRFFHNKLINYSLTYFENYFSYFSYDFLFTDRGLPDRYRVPDMGLLYLYELPFILLGLWTLFTFDKKRAGFFFVWIILTPVGAAFTFDDIPNLQRTLIVFPALSILVAYGFLFVWDFFARKKFGRIINILIGLAMIYGLFYYLHQYYVHQINHRPWYRQEGYKQLVSEVTAVHSNYKKVVVTHSESAPAIFFMFYNKYDPRLVQKQILSHPTNVPGRMPFENYVFPEEPCPLHALPTANTKQLPALSGEKNVLYVIGGDCKKLDDRVKVLSEIKRSDGTVVFTLQTVAE